MTALLTLIEKWATPAGLAIVCGIVIWLAQMERRTVDNAERLAEYQFTVKTISENQAEIASALARTTALHEALFAQVQQLDDRIERNESLIIQNRRESHEHNGNGE